MCMCLCVFNYVCLWYDVFKDIKEYMILHFSKLEPTFLFDGSQFPNPALSLDDITFPTVFLSFTVKPYSAAEIKTIYSSL